jgi:hypothetical protein
LRGTPAQSERDCDYLPKPFQKRSIFGHLEIASEHSSLSCEYAKPMPARASALQRLNFI